MRQKKLKVKLFSRPKRISSAYAKCILRWGKRLSWQARSSRAARERQGFLNFPPTSGSPLQFQRENNGIPFRPTVTNCRARILSRKLAHNLPHVVAGEHVQRVRSRSTPSRRIYLWERSLQSAKVTGIHSECLGNLWHTRCVQNPSGRTQNSSAISQKTTYDFQTLVEASR